MADTGLKTLHKVGKRVARRRNVDRSATTQRQIFEATIRCLGKNGYGAVTNIRVADEAGVSRGAMMHHFPTRQHLLVATVDYAYKRLSDHRMKALSKLPPGLPRYRALIDLAWTTARMPEGMACNEIRSGSRSDPEIRAAVTPIMSHISDDYARLAGRLVREAGLTPNSEIHGLTAVTVMTARSLAINTFTYPREQMVRNVLGALKTMRESIIARQLGAHVALTPEEIQKDNLIRIAVKKARVARRKSRD
jgi:AcrR family transcriptional regulator